MGLWDEDIHSLQKIFQEMEPVLIFFFAVIMAPLLEEVMFRLILRFRSNFLILWSIHIGVALHLGQKRSLLKTARKVWDKFYGWGIVDAGHAHHILSTQGCENAGGASPGDGETLSDFALGGRFQLDVGCFNDANCAAAADDVCAGEMRCNTVDHTCFQVKESGGFCDDNDPCTEDVCDPTRDIINGLEDLCVNTPKVCGDENVCNGVFSCEANTGECILDTHPIDCSDGDACSVDTL